MSSPPESPPEMTPTTGSTQRRSPSIATIAVTSILFAAACAVGAAWFFVLRPAENEARANDIAIEDFVNTDSTSKSPTKVAEVGQVAPDLELSGFTGGRFSISDLAGKPAVINFWASSCAPCVEEMPLIESVYQELGDEVSFVGVDVFEAPQLGQNMIDKTGVTYQQAADPTNELLAQFGGTQLPHTVILDADGFVVKMLSGPITDRDQLLQLIETAR